IFKGCRFLSRPRCYRPRQRKAGGLLPGRRCRKGNLPSPLPGRCSCMCAVPVAAVVIQLVGEILFPLVFCLAVSECLLVFHVLALISFFVMYILSSGADNSKSIQAIMYTIFCPQHCVLYSIPTGAKAKTDTSKRPGHPSPLPLPACLTRTQWSASRFR